MAKTKKTHRPASDQVAWVIRDEPVLRAGQEEKSKGLLGVLNGFDWLFGLLRWKRSVGSDGRANSLVLDIMLYVGRSYLFLVIVGGTFAIVGLFIATLFGLLALFLGLFFLRGLSSAVPPPRKRR